MAVSGLAPDQRRPAILLGIGGATLLRILLGSMALRLLDIPFEHDPLSVFSTFDQFSRVNPVVKAPTLVCDDGTVLMDSCLIIDYAETLAGRSLWPADLASRARALRVTGLALAACEKVMQIYYEHNLRPAAHAPWLQRVHQQLRASLIELDAELARHPLAADEKTLYVANSDPDKSIWMSFPVKEDGTLGEGKVFFDSTEAAKAKKRKKAR